MEMRANSEGHVFMSAFAASRTERMREEAEFAGVDFSAAAMSDAECASDCASDYASMTRAAPKATQLACVDTVFGDRPDGAAKLVAGAASLILLAIAGVVLTRTFAHIRIAELGEALRATSVVAVCASLAFTALSYLALTGYDVVALRSAGARVSYRLTALAAFASYAISFNIGFAVITAAAVRYWIYKRAGVTALQVANVTLAAGVTFWLGMTAAFGVAMLFGGAALAAADGLPALANAALGLLALAAIVAYCVWTGLAPRRMRLRGHVLELPGPMVTLVQAALGVADLFCAAAALFVLLPPDHGLTFIGFVAIYVVACILGVLSHAPGGIGVFEATVLHAAPAPSQESLLASLLLFRVVYYFIPFIAALALLGAHEGAQRWRRAKDILFNLDARG
jgi:glycosyltransferase 2 family protein